MPIFGGNAEIGLRAWGDGRSDNLCLHRPDVAAELAKPGFVNERGRVF